MPLLDSSCLTSEIEHGSDLSLNELLRVPGAPCEGGGGSSLGGPVASAPAGRLRSLLLAGGGVGICVGLGLLGAHSEGDLLLLEVDADDPDGDLLPGLKVVLNVGDEVVGDPGDVHKAVGGVAKVHKGAVRGDRLDLTDELLTDAELADGLFVHLVSLLGLGGVVSLVPGHAVSSIGASGSGIVDASNDVGDGLGHNLVAGGLRAESEGGTAVTTVAAGRLGLAGAAVATGAMGLLGAGAAVAAGRAARDGALDSLAGGHDTKGAGGAGDEGVCGCGGGDREWKVV